MDENDRDLLEKTHELAEDNNRMLKKLYSAYRWSRNTKIAYWTIIILLTFGAYYFIKPYIDFLTDTLGMGNATSTIEQKINTIRSMEGI